MTASVRVDVVFEILVCGKTLGAMRALMFLLLQVNCLLVSGTITASRKRFLTVLAFKGLFSSVCSEMDVYFTLRPKSLRAEIAPKVLSVCVGEAVAFEDLFVRSTERTDITIILHLLLPSHHGLTLLLLSRTFNHNHEWIDV